MTEEGKGDGLLRLAYALDINNQHKENDDLMKWLETATVDDLRLASPVLMNWIRNALKKKAKQEQKKDEKDDTEALILATTTTTEEVAQKIVKVLEDAIECDPEESLALSMGDNSEEERAKLQEKRAAVCSLQMALAGYLHTNHDKMRKVPVVADLERRTKAKLGFDRAACNTLNMVNAASASSLSISQYIKPEQESGFSAKGWGIPHIQIDLGLGLMQSSPADVCKEFIETKKPLLHPFTGETVGTMRVKKVFPSKRKPVWIEYFAGHVDGDDEPKHLKPDVLAKQGDDLRNDAAVTSVSKLCENIWAVAPIKWMLGTPPTVCAYDVLVTAPDAGYLEMVPGKNFLDLSQKVEGGVKTGWEAVNVQKLAPSLVGSYIVNFILGVRDRHEDNMMVVGDLKDDPKMMQIDFGYILMEFPGGVHFDMPRLTMPIALVDRFNSEPGRETDTTLMEDLQHDMLAAYLVLRRHSNQVIPFCAHLLSSSYDYNHVESVFNGKHVFRTDQKENQVIQWMSQKLTKQWAHFFFRREIKQGMVSGYYKFVETMTFENNGNDDKKGNKNFGEKIRNFFGQDRTDKSVGANTVQTADDDGEDIDMSKLNERVNTAMKLQKEISTMMISQKEKHGTLKMEGMEEVDEEDDQGGVKA
mmetsp:Transcript_10424/g.21945  ORF Transcript_10424/g.21945 Transcript_10424/m.21945 type:complete len:644 (+) Transcript_10424:138-2069(+)